MSFFAIVCEDKKQVILSVRIEIVDDHEVLREGVKSLLAKFRPDWQVCGEATNGQEAIQIAQDLKPDLIVLDISMPRMSGLEACSEMRKEGPGHSGFDIHHPSI